MSLVGYTLDNKYFTIFADKKLYIRIELLLIL